MAYIRRINGDELVSCKEVIDEYSARHYCREHREELGDGNKEMLHRISIELEE